MGNAIEVEHLSKRFMLRSERSRSLRELFTEGLRRSKKATSSQDFWALRDISFAVEPGTAVGIVGHNGSGKSTLLKLLTGIMKPTEGEVRAQGRLGALIEVGAGFHPDLSGRENVYLNGSILGLSRREIDTRLDEIVSFAGLEKFIDTPVKRYSSGMYMRLGFSIAAHTSPDILLVDEVLAVGDIIFQRKCMRKMKQFVAEGGVVIFVSHAMNQVAELCSRCIWLDRGKLLFDGATQEAADQYFALVAEREEDEFKRNHPEEWAEQQRLKEVEEAELRAAVQAEQEEQLAKQQQVRQWQLDTERARITRTTLYDPEGRALTTLQVGKAYRLEMQYRMPRRLPNPVFCVEILRTNDDLMMFATNSFQHGFNLQNIPLEGELYLDLTFMSLNEGRYRIRLHLFPDCEGESFHEVFSYEDRIENALEFEVSAGRFAHGCVFLPVEWEIGLPDTNLHVWNASSRQPETFLSGGVSG